MSIYYGLAVELVNVRQLTPEIIAQIKQEIEKFWPFEDWDSDPTMLYCYAEANKGGGDLMEDVVENMARAVKAKVKFNVEMMFNISYLEQTPTDCIGVDDFYYENVIDTDKKE